MSSAIAMIRRCAGHQTDDARHATTRELEPVQSRESSPPASETYFPPEAQGDPDVR